jgi:hypothetical protein
MRIVLAFIFSNLFSFLMGYIILTAVVKIINKSELGLFMAREEAYLEEKHLQDGEE